MVPRKRTRRWMRVSVVRWWGTASSALSVRRRLSRGLRQRKLHKRLRMVRMCHCQRSLSRLPTCAHIGRACLRDRPRPSVTTPPRSRSRSRPCSVRSQSRKPINLCPRSSAYSTMLRLPRGRPRTRAHRAATPSRSRLNQRTR